MHPATFLLLAASGLAPARLVSVLGAPLVRSETTFVTADGLDGLHPQSRAPLQKITTFLWFDDDAEEAIRFYCSIFQDSKLLDETRWGPGGPVPEGTLASLAREAAHCTRCPLHCSATQTVFGSGPEDAEIMIVGEQPGDHEDLAGKPFVGPAGQLFDRTLADAGIERKKLYVTNAVKHFKYETRGKRRIHQRPNAGEVEQCRWWLNQEIALIRPKLIVAMGATALYALTGGKEKLSEIRSRPLPMEEGRTLFVTVHPSYLLRLADAQVKEAEMMRFKKDISFIRTFE